MSEIGCIFLSFLACGAAQETQQRATLSCFVVPQVARADDSSQLERLLTFERIQPEGDGQQYIFVDPKVDLAH
jgi:hypothetical protein